MVLGLDGEDRDFYQRMLAFFERAKVTYTTPTYVTYVPGTRAYDQMRAAGRIITRDLRAYDGLHPIVVPDGMTLDELNEGLRWFIRRFFGLRSILRRLPDRWWADLPQLVTHLAVNLWFRSWYWMMVRRYGPDGRYMVDDQALFDRLTHHRYRRHWLWNVVRGLFTETSGVLTDRPVAEPQQGEPREVRPASTLA